MSDGDFAAQAYGESVGGPEVFENVSSERRWRPNTGKRLLKPLMASLNMLNPTNLYEPIRISTNLYKSMQIYTNLCEPIHTYMYPPAPLWGTRL